MSKQKNDDTCNNIETLTCSVLGGAICCYFVPSYTIYFVLGGVVCVCAYGIISVLDKYKDIEDMNFVEKEKVEYFRKK